MDTVALLDDLGRGGYAARLRGVVNDLYGPGADRGFFGDGGGAHRPADPDPQPGAEAGALPPDRYEVRAGPHAGHRLRVARPPAPDPDGGTDLFHARAEGVVHVAPPRLLPTGERILDARPHPDDPKRIRFTVAAEGE